jgi:hypothetical protein
MQGIGHIALGDVVEVLVRPHEAARGCRVRA